MRIVEIVLGEDHSGLEEAEYVMESMTKALILIGQGSIVQLCEEAGATPAQAIMLTNQMFSHFAANTAKATSN